MFVGDLLEILDTISVRISAFVINTVGQSRVTRKSDGD